MNRTLVLALVSTLATATLGCGSASSAAGVPATPGAASAASSTPLDGASFDVTLSFPGESPVRDTLRFTDGRFESTACTGLGFPRWSEYAAKVDPPAVAFSALVRHPDGTTVDWHGVVRGDVVDGTAVRTMGGQTAKGTVHGSRL